MDQQEKAVLFASLHVKGNPVVLYNIWDAGSASSVVQAGALAIATGSHSVAAAHGYTDAESIPPDLVERVVERICTSVTVPVSVDFEGAYSVEPGTAATNVERILKAGAIGINFEDQIIGGSGIHRIEDQCARLQAIRRMADAYGVGLFINARTDLFLKAASPDEHGALVDEAMRRAAAYGRAGASGFFVPGLMDDELIAEMSDKVALPLNIMMKPGVPALDRLAALGVARVSYGPGPYRETVRYLTERASAVYRSRLD